MDTIFLENTIMTTQNNAIIGFTAETFIHSGCGQSQGAIDQPFAREQATDYPYVPGSSLKGAFRDYARINTFNNIDKIFGQSETNSESGAGDLLVSDLRLLLLPVRSLTGAYRWVTCPHILKRLKRDLQRAGKSIEFSTEITYKIAGEQENQELLFLEELSFEATEAVVDDALFATLKSLYSIVEEKEKIVILNDDYFNWFAKNALSIQARNKLDENKATVGGALWYEENLPPDTLMYCLLSDRKTRNPVVTDILAQIKTKKYLQTGGNETVGMGWFQMQEYRGNNEDN